MIKLLFLILILLLGFSELATAPPFPGPFNEVTDLVVTINRTSVSFDPPNTAANQTITFNAIVKNRFGKEANATLEFRLDDISMENKTINAPGNSTQVLSFSFTRTKENHAITVIVDPEDVVNETYSYFEDNNEDKIIIYNQSVCGNDACENNENSDLCYEDCYKFYCDSAEDCIFQDDCGCGYYVNYKFYDPVMNCGGFLCAQICEERTVNCTNNTCITKISDKSNDSLKINKTIFKKNVKLGDTVTFSLVVENTGNNTAYNVAVRDNLEYGLNYINGSEIAFYCNETDNITNQCINYKEYT